MTSVIFTLGSAEQLLLSTATEDVEPATARDIERAASGPHLSRRAPPASFESVEALLTPAQCAQLVAHTEHLDPRVRYTTPFWCGSKAAGGR